MIRRLDAAIPGSDMIEDNIIAIEGRPHGAISSGFLFLVRVEAARCS